MDKQNPDNSLEEENQYVSNLNDFTDEVSSLLNRLSLDNDANTPDYILAEYLCNCYETYRTCKLATDGHNGHLTNKHKG